MNSTRRRRRLILAITVGGVIACTACYTYSAARPGVSLQNQPVHLSLTDSGSVVLASQIGPATTIVEGTLVTDSAGSYELSIQNTERRDGTVVDWKGERVTVPHVLVAGLGIRRFSATRTAVVGAGTVAAILGATAGFGSLGSVFGSGHRTGGVPGSR